MALFRVTDLKQWAYCERIVFYQAMMPEAGRATYKMREGVAAQEMVERLEMRRTLREYGLEEARRHFGVWLSDEGLGLSGKIDLLLEGGGVGSVVEFKLTAEEPAENHRLQLAGYAMLAEAVRGVRVQRAFFYRIPDGEVFAIEVGEPLREGVRRAVRGMRAMVEQELFPGPTPVRNRCAACEYANYCGDVW